MTNQRIFIGCYPEGIVYADRTVEQHGDYARLAFLSFATLELEFSASCPPHLHPEIRESAAHIQVRAGEQYQVSTSGQTVTLGWLHN